MSAVNIVELYDDCIEHIFAYLERADRINFAHVCQRFHQLFVSKCGKKYRQFTIDESKAKYDLIEFCICREVVQDLTVDLDHFNEARICRSHGCIAPVNCFGILCGTLNGMCSLQRLQIKQLEKLIIPIEKPFEQILTAVAGLKKLNTLEIYARDACFVENLNQLQHLQELQLHIPQLSSSTLAKCCKSNSQLRTLHLGYACVQKNLKDIVPHCRNLEILKFGMAADSSYYKPLGKLPKLKQLIHFGIRKSGSFEALLSALAAKPQLECLSIDGGSLNFKESQQVIRLQSLLQLKCFCLTVECVELLSELTRLEELCIWMSNSEDVSNALLKIVAKCRNLRLLRLAAGNVQSNFVDKVKELGTRTKPLKLEILFAGQTHTVDVMNCARGNNTLVNWTQV